MMIKANFTLDAKEITIAELKKILSGFPEEATVVLCSASGADVTIIYREEHTFSQPKFVTNDWNGQR